MLFFIMICHRSEISFPIGIQVSGVGLHFCYYFIDPSSLFLFGETDMATGCRVIV
ncbi:hypothetical protein GO755_30755 [Spirosoma sp. HMF4905]|uniref:Uncharacterized protein n=1 Tax=Spirosoma arboris TaxID=2682092 RepID=A0A7K1SKW0_9BACT|nr:hypothetical protein [Spirosoma arboris]MVM34452.1 hypothetical protein [Spirosoma arboris]